MTPRPLLDHAECNRLTSADLPRSGWEARGGPASRVSPVIGNGAKPGSALPRGCAAAWRVRPVRMRRGFSSPAPADSRLPSG